jgi:hypothetical protein
MSPALAFFVVSEAGVAKPAEPAPADPEPGSELLTTEQPPLLAPSQRLPRSLNRWLEARD